jgi:ABC-type glycerol-3-phosphate transport system permease component
VTVVEAPIRSETEVARARPAPRHGWFTPYLFLLPFGVLFLGFVLIPAVFGLWVSFHDYNYLLPGKPWTGLQNYLDLFTPGSRDSGDYWKSMPATGIFTVCSVPFLIVCPLGVALLLNRAFRGRGFFRAVFFAPYVLGVAVVGLLFRFVLDPNIGVVNYYLGHAIPWTTEVPWAWVSLVGMTVWWTLGFNAVIYMAGLQDISPELYEAARMDGASRFDEFRNVTLPGLRWFLNSLIAATGNAVLIVAVDAMAAYALARLRFRGRKVAFATVVGTLFVPPFVFLIPNFLIVSRLGWLDSLWALIVPSAGGAFGVFFLRQFFAALPVELEEAALIEGANQWQIFTRIVLPLARPALATLTVLSFLTNWNDFLWPVYVLFSADHLTLPAGLGNLQNAATTNYPIAMAGAVVASVPVLILFVAAQRHVIQSVTHSGLKG